jgi:hypothetical protein
VIPISSLNTKKDIGGLEITWFLLIWWNIVGVAASFQEVTYKFENNIKNPELNNWCTLSSPPTMPLFLLTSSNSCKVSSSRKNDS